ncbi:unnamed protein product [Prunus armeniaca]|uniref:Protein-serine/threonine phosphatase n=1 Tax=Prunus armeniaca TaxID=36596 RepID=A0A6J5VDQ6_PRUAR|nr:unnamed protein product [Prunus armeniaca]
MKQFWDGKKVAVKKPILSTSEDLDKFHKELQLLCKLDHPGIAKLVAAHAKPPNYMYFFEFFEPPNLSEKLHMEEWSPNINQGACAKALQYLHHLGIVHRDVKPANILLDKDLYPHLADFGLAEYKKDLKGVSIGNWRSSGKPTGGFHKKNMVGTLIYMAPEILKKEIHTEKSDVYSFGISINELLTGVVPYTDLRAEAQAHTVLEMNYTEQQLTAAVVSDGLRPVLAGPESGAPSTLLSLIERCWDANSQNRPSFDDIVAELGTILEQGENMKESDIFFPKSSNSLGDQPVYVASSLQAYQEGINWFSQGENFITRACLPKPGTAIWLASNDPLAYNPILSWGSFATCGRRETMEDTHFLLPQMFHQGDIHAFGIFDGHRGAAAAEFSARAFPGFLQALSSTSSPSGALFEAFIKTDIAFRAELDFSRKSKRVIQKDWHPGCTAAAALIVGNKLFVANAGDCRTILCRAGHPFVLSKDHVASCLEERERVISAGEQVRWQVDNWRVGLAALQVTRSIGDDDLKPAVTAEPEITETILSAEDEYLAYMLLEYSPLQLSLVRIRLFIYKFMCDTMMESWRPYTCMASDGLWDVVSNAEVVSIIKDTVKEPGMCSKRLATEAAERGSKDNITVIVVFLRPVSTAERIY